MIKGSPAVVVLPFLAACVIDDNAQPRIDVDFRANSAEVRRGMVQTRNGAAIPSTIISLPTKEEGTLIVMTEGSLELSDDTGNAWRPNGHSGRFARYDWSMLYEQRLEDVLLTFGVVSYNLPNGREFRFGERGSTTEMQFEAGIEVWGVQPAMRFNYDVDEVNGLYLEFAVAKSLQLAKDWHLALDLGMGWMDGKQAFWNYAQVPSTSGLADLRATADFSYTIDQHTSATFELGLSDVIDSGFRDWFDLIGVNPFQAWAGLGLHWSY